MAHSAAGITVIAMACLGVVASPPAIEVASGERPPVLDRVSTDDAILGIALSPDGELAAVVRAGADTGTTSLEIHTPDAVDPRLLGFNGVIRDLLFSEDATGLFLILYKPKQKRMGNAELVWVPVGDERPRTVLRLDPTAWSIDHWEAKSALLVAARNELTSILLDGLRTGRLFRILGDNLSLAVLASSDLVLVGQTDALLLLDLGDPPGEEEMPVRGRVAVDSPVIEIAAQPDGSRGLALLDDGSMLRVNGWPLAVTPDGRALAVASTGRSVSTRPLPLPIMTRTAAVPEPEQDPEVDDDGETLTPGVAVIVGESERQPPGEIPVSPREPAPEESPESPLETAADVPRAPVVVSEPEKAKVPPPEDTAQLWGRIEGPAASDVVEIVLLGPDSILVEARRVRPDPDGIWRVDDLSPGRYQVQLSGEQNRVLVSEPRLAVVEVGSTGPVEAETFNVLRAYAP